MTAEVAIANRQGIALAADSAVTIGRARVWKTANKLFSLGPHNDIAVMVYNAGDFVGIPWETVIKSFRTSLSNKRFDSVKDCENEFFKYLNSSVFSKNDWSDSSIHWIIYNFITEVKSRIEFKTRKQMQEALRARLIETREQLDQKEKLIDCLPEKHFERKFKSEIADMCKLVLKYKPTNEYFQELFDVIYLSLSTKSQSNFMSGVVFAGYGTSQILPYMSHYIVDGRFAYTENNKKHSCVRFWCKQRWDFSSIEQGSETEPSALIIPFAQYDMFYLFMEGLVPRFVKYIDRMLKKILDDKSSSIVDGFVESSQRLVEKKLQETENDAIVKAFNSEFREFRDKTLVKPVLNVIEALPKEEMAAMAQALVELTALRRKVGSNLETVGGPTDVAVISKGEGLIWLKRKHYFEPELNSDFVVRKQLLAGG